MEVDSNNITFGRFILERLKQLQVNTVFGRASPLTASLVDKISEIRGIRWACNTNELNAAYSADGYSRIKRLACLVTTFGSGELSAINGIAGSYAEHIAIVHIVLLPSISQKQEFCSFQRLYANISHSTAIIKNIKNAHTIVDKSIREAYIFQKPVYIAIPTNIVDSLLPRSVLDKRIDLILYPCFPKDERKILNTILDMISKAKKPVILIDACVLRQHCEVEAKALVDSTQFPVFVTPMGKGGIDEQHPRFCGVYVGSISFPEARETFESSDLVLSLGGLLSSFSTASFSFSYKTKNVIEFHSNHIKVREAFYPGIQMKYFLRKLVKEIPSAVKNYIPVIVRKQRVILPSLPSKAQVSQEYLWSKLSTWLMPNDIVITETGTSAFGILQTHFPSQTMGITQALWGSIGFTVGATLGACMALQESNPSKRVLLFIGDGSIQLTMQEISTMVRWNLKPFIFVLNNEGFTIERLVHGINSQYNDVQPWRNLDLLYLFNAKDYDTVKISNRHELDLLFEDQRFCVNDKIRMIEIMLPRLDAPRNLIQHSLLTSSWDGLEDEEIME